MALLAAVLRVVVEELLELLREETSPIRRVAEELMEMVEMERSMDLAAREDTAGLEPQEVSVSHPTRLLRSPPTRTIPSSWELQAPLEVAQVVTSRLNLERRAVADPS